MSWFRSASKVRFDGFYESDPHQENIGERAYLRFYPNGRCLQYYSTLKDTSIIVYSLDLSSSEIGTGSGMAGTYTNDQWDIDIMVQSNSGREVYEGSVMSNGGLKTDWMYFASNVGYAPQRSGRFYFSFNPYRWSSR